MIIYSIVHPLPASQPARQTDRQTDSSCNCSRIHSFQLWLKRLFKWIDRVGNYDVFHLKKREEPPIESTRRKRRKCPFVSFFCHRRWTTGLGRRAATAGTFFKRPGTLVSVEIRWNYRKLIFFFFLVISRVTVQFPGGRCVIFSRKNFSVV